MTGCHREKETYEIFNSACVGSQHNRCSVVGCLSLRLSVDSPEVELIPHHLQQFINVPAVLGTDGAGVGNPVKQVQLFDRDRVNLVQRIYDRNICPTLCLKNIDNVIDCGVASD